MSIGVGLVAFNMSFLDIENLSASIALINPVYQVVVDNSPSSISSTAFKELGWTYIHNPKNPGFGASHNLIFDKYSKKAEYHLIVNPDIVFSDDVIPTLLNFLENQSSTQ